MNMYKCESDKYDPHGSEYESVDEFLNMCQECFGEKPNLIENITGDWFDEDGQLVLSINRG